ncbi:MAG: hypothetical protein QM723_05640 [Myxococcaceae bacterium]
MGLGARVHDTREACRDLYGDAALEAVLSALAPEHRALFVRGASVPKWIPEAAYVDWLSRLWEGPLGRDLAELSRWSARITDRGFGTARRVLLSFASPWLILRRAQMLWNAEHDTGTLVATPASKTSSVVVLTGHPFCETEVARAAISEALRHIILRCRVKTVTQAHRPLANGALEITLEWV